MNDPLPPHFAPPAPPHRSRHGATLPAGPNVFPHPVPSTATLASQHDLDPSDFFQFEGHLVNEADVFDQPNHYARHSGAARFDPSRANDHRSQYQVYGSGPHGQIGRGPHVLPSQPSLPSQPVTKPARNVSTRPVRAQDEIALRPKPAPAASKEPSDGHFSGMKMISDPPDLASWRQKLFELEDTLILTADKFQTYFPHVDNIYSHRSTQRYKRKPFVSHYWDCRLKGRPSGTAKSEDPNKKKRKRVARERDLCDVKIKITEYTAPPADDTHKGPNSRRLSRRGQQDGADDQAIDYSTLPPAPSDTRPGEKYYSIQRVLNAGPQLSNSPALETGHKHTLEESDRVKKNSVLRFVAREAKDSKKVKSYHQKATGKALTTVNARCKEHELKLFGSCFCPFVQRVWISLELKGLDYQYIEVDPYKKPEQLLAVNPRGLIPALKHGDWGCYESSVLMEYLEDLGTGYPLLPQSSSTIATAQTRAHCRLWADHINRKILPAFYGLLQAQEPEKQASRASELRDHLAKIIDAAHPTGPFFLGPQISFVDVQFAPWILRFRRVLKPYRGWPDPEPGTRWAAWVDAVERDEAVRATTSTDELYVDSYERYAENRPNTSQVANAVNEGAGLP